MLSIEDYEHFEALEEKLWSLAAKSAEKEGFLSAEDSEDLLNQLLGHHHVPPSSQQTKRKMLKTTKRQTT